MKLLDDNELVKLIQQSQNPQKIRKCQEELYHRFAQQVYAKCLVVVKNQHTAQDLSHDIFIKIFLNLNSFKGNAPFGSWVNSITYNHSINYLKKERKLKIAGDVDIIEEEVKTEDDIVELMSREKDFELMEQAILLLKEGDRIILIMKYTDNMSVQEISQKFNIKESATKMRLKRSRTHLHEIMKQLKNEREE